jgi:hypothetical protein
MVLVIVGAVVDCAQLIVVQAILNFVRVVALARASVVVARQALVIVAGAGTVSRFVRVGPVVLVFVGIVID